MGRPNGRPTRLVLCVLSISLVLLVFGMIHGRECRAQAHRGADRQTDFPQPAAKPSPTGEGSFTEISAQLRSLRGRIETLEKREKDLRRQARSMTHEIRRLEGLLDGTSGLGDRGPRGVDIGRVTRTAGRPDARDPMVSVAGMVAVWRQIDAILAKLDEITTALSGP